MHKTKNALNINTWRFLVRSCSMSLLNRNKRILHYNQKLTIDNRRKYQNSCEAHSVSRRRASKNHLVNCSFCITKFSEFICNLELQILNLARPDMPRLCGLFYDAASISDYTSIMLICSLMNCKRFERRRP